MKHPTALTAYNRPHCVRQMIDTLREFRPEPLYVFCDGPVDNTVDISAVQNVRDFVREIEWTEPAVVERDEHLGRARSVVGAVDWVLERHETVIVLEDDCVPLRGFYDFMAQCLERYVGEERIMAACAFRPIGTDLDKALAGYPHDAFMAPFPNTWGWGTWRRAWAHYVRDGDLATRYGEVDVDFGWAGEWSHAWVRKKLGDPALDVWSPGWFLAFILHSGLAVYPKELLINNTGASLGAIAEWKPGGDSFRLPEPGLHPPIRDVLLESMKLGLSDAD